MTEDELRAAITPKREVQHDHRLTPALTPDEAAHCGMAAVTALDSSPTPACGDSLYRRHQIPRAQKGRSTDPRTPPTYRPDQRGD